MKRLVLVLALVGFAVTAFADDCRYWGSRERKPATCGTFDEGTSKQFVHDFTCKVLRGQMLDAYAALMARCVSWYIQDRYTSPEFSALGRAGQASKTSTYVQNCQQDLFPSGIVAPPVPEVTCDSGAAAPKEFSGGDCDYWTRSWTPIGSVKFVPTRKPRLCETFDKGHGARLMRFVADRSEYWPSKRGETMDVRDDIGYCIAWHVQDKITGGGFHDIKGQEYKDVMNQFLKDCEATLYPMK
jgi:hypothetical protein